MAWRVAHATNEISGKVEAKESGLGIPGLLVVVFDYPGTVPEELVLVRAQGRSGAIPAVRGRGVRGDRLGSVVTDGTGAFTLTYEDDAFRVRHSRERRPDLCLTVLAPEDADTSGGPRMILASPAVRHNAGRSEQYLIRLTADQLSRAGVVAPTTPSGCPPDSRKTWDDYNHKQEFEHELINRKTTWSLTTQGILFAAYGLTFSAKASQGLSHFRSAVAVAGLVVAILTFIGVAFLITSKLISYIRYRQYYEEHFDCLPEPKGKHLAWGSAGGWVTTLTLAPDLGIPVLLIVAWSMLLP